MKKTFVTVLVTAVLTLALIGAGVFGYLWYRNNHVFIEDAVYPLDAATLDLREEEISFEHYDALHAQLPDCEILWNVPFQGGKLSNDTTQITLRTLTEEDIRILMDYLPRLKTVDALGCREYGMLELLKAQLPEVRVDYAVTLGAMDAQPDASELILEPQDYDYDTLLENLLYLPQVRTIRLKTPEISLEQINALKEAYPEISISCTVDILGTEYDAETAYLDLSAMTSSDVADFVEKLPLLPALTEIQLMDESGNSSLTKEDVRTLQQAAPGVVFHYTFDFYGVKLSTADESVHIVSKRIGDEGEAEVRLALDIMTNCKRFVLEYCSLSNEVLAKVRDDYRDRTKIVWRVFFGGGSTMTDAEVIRCTYDLRDHNSHDLIYCEDVRFVDIGHNELIFNVDFVAGMKNLEMIIISGSPVKDLTPFAQCKNLKILEAAFCNYIEDISPLAQCESLEMVNISYTQVKDLSPLDGLNLTNVCAMYEGKSRVPLEEQERFRALKPDCEMHFVGSQPYGSVWRYDADNNKRPWYQEICDAFRYPDPPNNAGWYL